MNTHIETLHNRALRATGAAEDRALVAGSARLANAAREAHAIAEAAYRRQDAGMLQRAIAAAVSIGRRIRRSVQS